MGPIVDEGVDARHGDDAVDETDVHGLLGVDDVGEQDELLRLVQADEPRQHPRTAEVDRQSTASEDLGEPRVVARHHQIASEREIQTSASSNAYYLRDGRLLNRV